MSVKNQALDDGNKFPFVITKKANPKKKKGGVKK